MSHYCLREYVALRSFPTRRSSDLEAFAPLLAGSFARLLDLWRASDPGLLVHAWLARAHSLGTHLTVHTGKDEDRKSTRLNSSHLVNSYAVFCMKGKN